MNKSVLLLPTGNIRRQDHGCITINETVSRVEIREILHALRTLESIEITLLLTEGEREGREREGEREKHDDNVAVEKRMRKQSRKQEKRIRKLRGH